MAGFETQVERYGVEFLPTVVILRGDGEERDRIVNFPGLKLEFLQFIEAAARGDRSFEIWKEGFRGNPAAVDTGYRLFMKYLYRGDLEQAVLTGRQILDRPELAVSFPSYEDMSESRKSVYGDVRFHLRTSIHRSNKATIYRYIPLFPEIKFAERAYWFVARTFIRQQIGSPETQSLLNIALKHYPESRALKKLAREYAFRCAFLLLPFISSA